MKHLAIAKTCNLPLDVVTQKLAFVGRTGSGKTYAATKLAELIRYAAAGKMPLARIAKSYGVAPSTIRLAVLGRTWKPEEVRSPKEAAR